MRYRVWVGGLQKNTQDRFCRDMNWLVLCGCSSEVFVEVVQVLRNNYNIHVLTISVITSIIWSLSEYLVF
jgi:hypothetical protein